MFGNKKPLTHRDDDDDVENQQNVGNADHSLPENNGDLGSAIPSTGGDNPQTFFGSTPNSEMPPGALANSRQESGETADDEEEEVRLIKT